MAILNPGKTKCASCGRVLLEDDDIASFPAFLPRSHPLALFSDACFHSTCFAAHPSSAQVSALHESFQALFHECRERFETEEGEEGREWMRAGLQRLGLL